MKQYRMRWLLSAAVVMSLAAFLAGRLQANDETPDILRAGHGYITWTNVNPELYYTVEWQSSLTNGPWLSMYELFRDIRSGESTVSRPLPAFFRVRAHEAPEYLRVMSPTSHWMEAGFYPATNLTLTEPNLAAENIRGGVTVFGVAGTVLPSTGDAAPEHVLDGRTFSNTEASGATGIMPDRGAQNITPGATAQAILQGYHDGMGEVAGDADLAAANIKAGVSIFGVDGNVVESTGDATAGQVLAGATFSKADDAGLTGTMPNQADRGFMPGAADVPVPAGYYDGSGVVTGDAALVTGNIRAGATIFGVAGDPNVVDTADADVVAGDILADRVAYVGGTAVTGTIATLTLSPDSAAVAEGFYVATNLTAVAPALAAGNIRHAVELFGVTGTVLQATGDALAAHVLTGQTFSRADAVDVAGTMPNRGAQSITPKATAQVILQGYHDGTGEVAGDADLTEANIKSGVNIFGVDGNVVESTGDATAGQVLEGVTFSKAGEAGLTGTMPNQADRGFMPGAADVPVPAGYYDGSGVVTGDAALVAGNIRAGATIFGVAGDPNVVDTSSGDALSGDLLAGKKAWVEGGEVTGTVPAGNNLNGDDGSLVITITDGLYTGSKTATASDADLISGNIRQGVNIFGVNGAGNVADTGSGTAIPADILAGQKAWVQGMELTGTMPTRTLSSANDTVQAGYYAATTLSAVDANLVAANIPYGVKLFGIQGTGNPKAGMALIPAGDFVKTDHPDGANWVTNYISAFYISRTHITKAQWDAVRSWASTNEYTDLPAGGGKGADHPVQTVNWYDAVKWCNARSEMEGRPPVYFTDGSQTTVYRTGNLNLTNACVAWTSPGYRLPTESEWEKAARGGLHAHRFPWGHTTNRISHAQANFWNGGGEAYQYGTTGFHPDWNDGVMPYTSPVGSFVPNGYGLYDMAGNVWGWCWDRYAAAGSYYVSGSDPKGPDTGSIRVFRGGSWLNTASLGRSAHRDTYDPSNAISFLGFRVALPSAADP